MSLVNVVIRGIGMWGDTAGRMEGQAGMICLLWDSCCIIAMLRRSVYATPVYAAEQ